MVREIIRDVLIFVLLLIGFFVSFNITGSAASKEDGFKSLGCWLGLAATIGFGYLIYKFLW